MAKAKISGKKVPRTGERRKLLTEEEFRSLVETGKARQGDRRSWSDRRRQK